MTIKLQIFLILFVLIFLVIILRLLKNGALELRYSILWFLTGIVLLLLGIFPGIMTWVSGILGVYDVTNGLFAIALFFILLMLISLTSIVSKLNRQNKEMAQKASLLDRELRELKNNINNETTNEK